MLDQNVRRSAIVLSVALAAAAAIGAEPNEIEQLKARLAEQAARVSELERKDTANWLTEERATQIKSLVHEVLDDARTRGQFLDGDAQVGFKDGFFVKSADDNFKLVVNGIVQVRYSYVGHHASHTGGPKGANTNPFAQGTSENASGFELRRARLRFSGNVFSQDLFYRLEGDFYSSSEVASVDVSKGTSSSTSGNFAVTDAFIGYRFSPLLAVRAGAFKVPFSKVELMNDAYLSTTERPEPNTPFDAQRSLGVSLFGDLVKDQLAYEVNVNNGSNSQTFRRVDTASSSASNPNYNLDNRLGYYGRVNWSPGGSIEEFFKSEPDLRKDTSQFIWLLGVAAGYESQNSTNGAFVQNTAVVPGIGGNNGPGYTSNYVLNGDLYRGTVDWSAKYRGLALNTAAYFQQVNANPVVGSAIGAGNPKPYGPGKSSFFQHGYYGQVGYMIVPARLELVGRAGVLLEEGDPNIAEFYTLGLNYYLHGHNAKIQADMTYSPEAPFTDTGSALVQNSHQVAFRVQLQLRF